MPAPPLHLRPGRLRRTALLALLAVLAALVLPFLGSGTATAVASPQADAASAWLAAKVGPDGSVDGTVPGVASVGDTVNVAVSLAMTGTQPDALARAMGYISTHVETYVNDGTTDLAGRLGLLMILAHAQGQSPTAFGSPATNLVTRLQALLGTSEPGFYGSPNPFSATTDQSLAITGLVAAGAPVPAAAVQWLLDQQCGDGGWQGYRTSTGGVPDPCGSGFSGPDTNSTAVAVQALAVAGASTGVTSGLAFLKAAQDTTGSGAGGFPFFAGDDADPNSTAVVIQAIVAAGQDPSSSAWSAGGGTPLTSLASWVVPSGADAGALTTAFAVPAGSADFLATFQGVWGFTQTAFPFLAVPPVTAPTTTTTTTGASSSTIPVTAGAVIVTPSFTG